MHQSSPAFVSTWNLAQQIKRIGVAPNKLARRLCASGEHAGPLIACLRDVAKS